MAVRLLGSEDEDLVRRVLRRVKGDETSEPGEFLRDPRTLMVVSEDDGGVAGWLYGHELIRPDGRRPMLLYEIEVGPGARGRGQGETWLTRCWQRPGRALISRCGCSPTLTMQPLRRSTRQAEQNTRHR